MKLLFALCIASMMTAQATELKINIEDRETSNTFNDVYNDEHLGIFHNILENTKNSFTGNNLYAHIGAFASTYAIAKSGIDQDMYDLSLKNRLGNGFGEWAFATGAVIQPLVGASLYLSSDPETKTAGAAVLQTMIVQSTYVFLLKGITGRPDPVTDGKLENADPKGTACGNSFDPEVFFDITNGCSWPSGHTSSAVSLVSTLYAFYPEKEWIAYIGYPVAMGIGLGMVDRDEHWTSEIVAGALIGHVIGWTIGKNFRVDYNQLHSNHSPKKHFITPKLSDNGKIGIDYTYKY